MSTFLPSPTKPPRGRGESGKSTASDVAAFHSRHYSRKGESPAKEMAMVVWTQNDVQQNVWRGEARRCFIEAAPTKDGSRRDDKDGQQQRRQHQHQRSSHNENPEHIIRMFGDWLTMVEKGQGLISTAHQSDLCLWFHEERLAAKTPFAAVVPCPASLLTEKARQSVMRTIDNFAFSTFYVQTLPMGAKLSEVSQVFVHTPAHLPESTRYCGGEEKGRYVYTRLPCHNGADAMDLISRHMLLRDAVRDVPCLLLNDFCPLTPLCLRCLVVAGCCVAAEVACDEAYTPLFGIRPNNTGERYNDFDDSDFMGEEHTTVGERHRASAAAQRREAPAVKRGDTDGDYRTASDVIAFGLKRFVEETLGSSLGGRSYSALIAAEVKGFDPRVLGPRESDPPFWPLMTSEPLHQRPSPFGEAGLRFYALSFDYADPTAFEAFAPQELHAVGDYVVEREVEGVSLPPILRFLDGHEAERAAAHPPPAWTASPFAKSSPIRSETSSGTATDGDRKDRKQPRYKSFSSQSASTADASKHSVVDGTSSTVSSLYPNEEGAVLRAADAAKAPASHTRRELASSKANNPSSPVKSAPMVLEQHGRDNRGGKDGSALPGRVNLVDVDDLSSTISSTSRASGRLPSRSSSFNCLSLTPNTNSGNAAALAERPATMRDVDLAVKSHTTTTTASPRTQHRGNGRTEQTSSEALVPSQRDSSASVERDETASSTLTHASRLPKRRLSGAASSVASGSQRSSVARGDDLTTDMESARSSLPPRRRSSVLAAVAIPRVAAVVTAPAGETESASPHHTQSEVSTTAQYSTALLHGDTDVPSPLQPEDISVVASPTYSLSQHPLASTAAVPSTCLSHSQVFPNEQGVARATDVAEPQSTKEGEEKASSAKSKSPSASVRSSVSRPMMMPSPHSDGAPNVNTHTAGSATADTASVAESVSTRASVSASLRTELSAAAGPPACVPEMLQYDDDDAEESMVNEQRQLSSVKPASVRDRTSSVYSSTYVSTHSGLNRARHRDVPAIEKEKIPYINSPLSTPASSEVKSTVTASSVKSSVAPSSIRAPYSPAGNMARAVEATDIESAKESSVKHSDDHGKDDEESHRTGSEATSSITRGSARALPSQRSLRPALTTTRSDRDGATDLSVAAGEAPSTPPRQTTEIITAPLAHPAEESPVSAPNKSQLIEQEMADLESASSVSQPHAQSFHYTSRREEMELSVKSSVKSASMTSEVLEGERLSEVPSVADSWSERSGVPASGLDDEGSAFAKVVSASERSAYSAPRPYIDNPPSVRSSRLAENYGTDGQQEVALSVKSSVSSFKRPSVKSSVEKFLFEASVKHDEEHFEVPSVTDSMSRRSGDPADAATADRVSEKPSSAKAVSASQQYAFSAPRPYTRQTPSVGSSRRAEGCNEEIEVTPSVKSSVLSSVKPSVKPLSTSSEAAKSSREGDAASAVKSSAHTIASPQLSAERSVVANAEELLARNDQMQRVESTPAWTKEGSLAPAAVSHSYSSSSSSSSSCSYCYTSSLRVVSPSSAAAAATAQPARSHASLQPHEEHTATKVEDAVGHEGAAVEEIVTGANQRSYSGSRFFRGEEGSYVTKEKGENEEVGVVVEVDTAVHEDLAADAASQLPSEEASSSYHCCDDAEKEEKISDGDCARFDAAAATEESLVPSAHSFFDIAKGPEKEDDASSSTRATSHAAVGENENEELNKSDEAPVADTAPITTDVDEMQSTGLSSVTGTQSELQRVNSADLHSCISASAVSSQSNVLRRWASGLSSDRNYAASLASRASRRGTAPASPASAVPSLAEKKTEEVPPLALSMRSTVSAKRTKCSVNSEVLKSAPAAASVASQRSTTTSSKFGSAPSSVAKVDESAVSEQDTVAMLSVVKTTALVPTSFNSGELSATKTADEEASQRLLLQMPSEGKAAGSLFQHASTASGGGKCNASANAAAEQAEGANEPAPALNTAPTAATSGVPADDRGTALRKARLRAMAAVIIAQAAYEEVGRVTAMYK